MPVRIGVKGGLPPKEWTPSFILFSRDISPTFNDGSCVERAQRFTFARIVEGSLPDCQDGGVDSLRFRPILTGIEIDSVGDNRSKYGASGCFRRILEEACVYNACGATSENFVSLDQSEKLAIFALPRGG